MARVSVEMPAKVVDSIQETVLLLYGATAESLHLALRARGGERRSAAEVDLHRTRLAELEELLRELESPARPLRVEATHAVLHDALYGALIDAGERLASISEQSWRGELPLERVQEAAEEVLTIDRLLRELR